MYGNTDYIMEEQAVYSKRIIYTEKKIGHGWAFANWVNLTQSQPDIDSIDSVMTKRPFKWVLFSDHILGSQNVNEQTLVLASYQFDAVRAGHILMTSWKHPGNAFWY